LPALLSTAIPETIEEVGAIAGIASFVLMVALLVLYIIRALELRKLRKTMPFLVEPGNGNGQPPEGSGRASSGRVR
jgi:hypothetical protein